MGGGKGQRINGLGHGEELLQGLLGGRRHRQLLKDATTAVIDQQHQQGRPIGIG